MTARKCNEGFLRTKIVRYHLRYQNQPFGRKQQRPSEEGLCNQRFILAPRPGLEPGTCGLTVRVLDTLPCINIEQLIIYQVLTLCIAQVRAAIRRTKMDENWIRNKIYHP
jgi:hypothetical protein